MSGEAQRLINVMREVIEQETGNSAGIEYEVGVVEVGGAGTCTVMLRAGDDLVEDVEVPAGTWVSQGTSVVIGTTKEGEVFISRILPGTYNDNAIVVTDPNTGQIGIYDEDNNQYDWGQPGQAITSSGPYDAPYWHDNTPPPAPPPLPSWVEGDGQWHLYDDFNGASGTIIKAPYANEAYEPYWDAVPYSDTNLTETYLGWELQGDGTARPTGGWAIFYQHNIDYSSAYVGPWDGGYPNWKIYFTVNSQHSIDPYDIDHREHYHQLSLYWSGGPVNVTEYSNRIYDHIDVVVDFGTGEVPFRYMDWAPEPGPVLGETMLFLFNHHGSVNRNWHQISFTNGVEYCLEVRTSPAKWEATIYPSSGAATWWIETDMGPEDVVTDPNFRGFWGMEACDWSSEGDVWRVNGIDMMYASPPEVFQNFHDVLIAIGDGSQDSFLGYPTVNGTVQWAVDGLVVHPTSFNEATGAVTFDRAPAYLSNITQSGTNSGTRNYV